MVIYNHADYKKFEETVMESIKNKANLILFALPGVGSTFFIKKFLEKEGRKNISYKTTGNEGLTGYNFLDLDFYKNDKALEIVDEYFRLAAVEQNFAVVVNTPYIVDTDLFKNSFLANHIYREFFFSLTDVDRVRIMADNFSINVSDDDIQKIVKTTSGVGGLVKYLLLNPDKAKLTVDELVQDKSFLSVFLAITDVISKCSKDILSKFGIIKDGEFVGEVFRIYFAANPMSARVNINVFPDLSFYEDNIKNSNTLLKIEKEILEYLINNKGVITKEKIADLKWGDGSYDEYSDQAIFKTIARLKKKLDKYTLIPIPGYGYKLD